MRADVQHLFDQAAEQAERNRADFLKNNDLYQSAILHLTGHIRNCMQAAAAGRRIRPAGSRGRPPHLAAAGAERRKGIPPQRGGEQSRFYRRSAARRLGLAPALSGDHRCTRLYSGQKPGRLRHSVRVSSFCSLRGFTVARILKDFSEKNAERKIFSTLPPAGTGTDWRCAWRES